ncbi:MAG: hypothetical protein SFU83_22290 [Meiothermus sp.]|nr:hypothetical protein [Meiothermus sp.]
MNPHFLLPHTQEHLERLHREAAQQALARQAARPPVAWLEPLLHALRPTRSSARPKPVA